MALADTNGRRWANLQTVEAGDFLVADDGFTCIEAGIRQRVRAAKNLGKGTGRLYVNCSCEGGRHFLYGQADEHGELIGFYPG